ncbi:hypothetical protein GRI38_11405 [Altererythrobacter aurantiacus]|uniref:Lipoprotein n=1 Tax=Parapontixanthobacter aurantiacus TaxID=1463599 RepID=A0A844ZDL9_9SPHN|nr:hypothetical protein [Parapontixanthobacter aurantiacus]MXO86631.1 hypothetical protein [Parapontixanthobacter aurantiacus]
MISTLSRYFSRNSFALAAAVLLASCAYGPVVVDDYAEAASYEELIAGVPDDSELNAAIDKNVLRVMTPGEQVAGWSTSGTDLDTVVEAASGGWDGNVLRFTRANEVSYGSDRDFAQYFGDGYTVYPVLGPQTAFDQRGDGLVFGLIRIGEGVWFESVKREEKQGNAGCSSTGAQSARLFANRPYASLSKLEKSLLAAFVAAAGRDDVTVCSLGEEVGEGRYRSRYFMPDGRRLPVFDREAPQVGIVARSELARSIGS